MPDDDEDDDDTHWMVRTKDNDELSFPERMFRSITEEGTPSTTTTTTTTAESDNDTTSELRSSPLKRNKTSLKSKNKSVVSRKTTATTNNSNKKQLLSNDKIHTTRAATRSSGNTVGLFKGIEEIVLPPKQPRASKVSQNNDNVLKVPMLTGTLYMYRDGPKRRVKFVRTK